MRDGEIIDTMAINETDKDDLVQKMVGRKLTMMFPARSEKN